MYSDEVLVVQAISGKQEAFEELVIRYRALVYYVIMQTITDPQEAEDIVQDVFVSAFGTLNGFDSSKACFKTWLFNIVKKRSIDWLRKPKRALSVHEEVLAEMDIQARENPENAFIDKEFHEALKHAFKSLGEEQRLCLALKSIEGLSYAEIAQIVGIPIGTVRSRISNARKNLIKKLTFFIEDGIQCDVAKLKTY
ncbi:MAG: hypothetical protein COW32_09815 [Candidatus Aquicultor secundus]|uniref:RNA polymerase sigma factor n=1 Tax=Candidatus Aquicultor secundus TaxID=1973895 RepID=A0A2M7T8Q3_9ACTN|nr:sigma-70 family RNA polymerase sigma factor [Candidatus Aquicultor secundus]OIO85547.1 MAG: hypothetical protein AUK32_07005 [Candidatus Aquicultor secundus]PIU27283.1 MAG: hypothetical protein COT10_04270 [Candidatus Aquicultor secundus]PIW21460.1 MAG: hypothetical protein COW32_09815 [Candidatus Aquicultor secundus]PIX52870.1 MAG: hypothetical protein COZ51_01845 [Candidatus Aquicultor secundus]PIY37947.1 MAG: hypothetical protein COZ03_09145 [Candidatus Aquicultor secundus]